MRPPAVRDPLLHAILAAAAGATEAARGWMLAIDGEQLEVVALCGTARESLLGSRGPRQFGWAGFAVQSRQPLALVPGPDDPRFLGDLVADPVARPASLLCFPCPYGDGAVGALQLEDKAGGTPFRLDDVEVVGYLADVAGAAMAERAARVGGATGPPAPDEFGVALQRMAADHPARFLAIAALVEEVLQRS